MHRLHGGDHAELSKSRKVLGGHHLGMLDAGAAVARPIPLHHSREGVERDAIGGVADGVKGELEASVVALDGQSLQLFRLEPQDAAGGGIIGVRRQQRRGARTQRDRKSTRLNSSHGYISYAVFCLKKKKKRQQHTTTNRTT